MKPTKSNLIGLQKRLVFAVRGETFLEYRREQLVFQIKRLGKEYLEIRKNFIDLFKQSLIKLNQTYEEMGKNGVVLISKLSRIQYKPMIDIQYQKKVGIVVPKINYEFFQEEKLPAYTFEDTSHFLDDLIILLKEFFKEMIKFTEIEDLLLKHAVSFKKVNRRINGLKNMIIPKMKTDIKQIKEILEEIERENYVRLKKTKDLIISQGKTT
ncbi:MAG: V-type ATP synthase subunit D [Candidatus Hodarchaeota archaeon]